MRFSFNSEKGAVDVYRTIVFTMALGFEILDWILQLLNLTGIAIIVFIVLDLVKIAMFASLQLAFEGFSFKNLFKSWKQALLVVGSFIIELIPVADLFPGWLVAVVSWTMFTPRTKEEVAQKITGASSEA